MGKKEIIINYRWKLLTIFKQKTKIKNDIDIITDMINMMFVDDVDVLTISKDLAWLKKQGMIGFDDKNNELKITEFGMIFFDEELKKKKLNKKFQEGIIKFTDFIDMAQQFIKIQPMFYTSEKIWWIWDSDNKSWKIVDEIDIMNILDSVLNTSDKTTKTSIRLEILESLKRVGRKNIPKKIPKTWVQFKDKIVDIKTGKTFDSTHEYFSTNPLPYKIGKDENTPTIDKLFEEWVGKKWVNTLYEIVAYCMLPDYPMHRIFCLNGSGLNGKGTFLRLLQKFIGSQNTCSTELDILLRSRFEVGKLYKKLLCQMGETNFSGLKQTSLLKRLTGQDLIGFEFKNKIPFDDYNYAKIIIATNTLPITYDKTVGFYRRWLIIDFPNEFSERVDVLESVPEEEYKNLAKKSVRILKELMERRCFTNEGTIEERMVRYEELSNPIKDFIKDNYEH